jgi:hypothetical protein
MPETPDIQPVGAGDWIRQLVYAYPGWGKTSYIGTQPKTLIIHSSLDLMEKMDEVLDYCRMAEPFPYEWVWLDCISTAQDIWLDDIWASTIVLYPHRDNKTIKGGLDKGEYGRNMDMIMRWIRHMVGANRFHFGITAHPWDGPHPTNDEGNDLLQPWIQGKMMIPKACGYMNMVGFLEVMEDRDTKKQWRRLHFKENPRFYAKDQYDAFLPQGYVDNPSIAGVMKAVEAARGRKLGTTPTGRRRRGAAAAPATSPKRGRRSAA